MRIIGALLVLTLWAGDAAAQLLRNAWEDSLVTVEVTRKRYDYLQPWTRLTATEVKNGVVIGERELLTTAEYLNDLTLVRVQRNGRGRWWKADVKWVDYHANLALVTVPEEAFWAGLKAAKLPAQLKELDRLQVVRWRNGNLEVRSAEFNEFTVREGKVSFLPHVQLMVSSEMEGLGWAEAVVANGSLIGLASSGEQRRFTVTPAPFIRQVVEAQRAGGYRGLGHFAFTWQQAINPDVHRFLGWKGEPKGVVVIDVPKEAQQTDGLKVRDLILEIEGFAIDIQGDYEDPDYGHLMLENLSTRNKWAGDTVKLKVWRNGAPVEVRYVLPKADFKVDLIPKEVFDTEPRYLVVGGLLFQPLDGGYLKRWGNDWRQRAPFRLAYYENESKTPDRPGLLLLSLVLPDAVNLGYHDLRFLVVDKVNGRKVAQLEGLIAALEKPVDGFHVVEFMPGSTVQKLVLDAAEAEQAKKRILENYGLTTDRFLPMTP